MPTYVYQCPVCNERFERWQSFKEDPLTVCPQGHEGVRKVFTPSPVIFKGSGWYITDSRGGKGATNQIVKDDANGSAATKSEAASESTAESTVASTTESKTESKAESKAESKPEATGAAKAAD